VVESLGFLVRKGHDLASPIREPFKHVHLPSAGRVGPTPRVENPSRERNAHVKYELADAKFSPAIVDAPCG
jgi:hypothetical protein